MRPTGENQERGERRIMIRLNRTTEYGLMALRHMSKQMHGALRAPESAKAGFAGTEIAGVQGSLSTAGSDAGSDTQPWSSAREIAEAYHLPFEITAKTLQRLKDAGWIRSAHGARGGYLLNCVLSEVSFLEFLQSMEGPQGVVACSSLSKPLASPARLSKKSSVGEVEVKEASAATLASGSSTPSCEYGARCEIKHFMGQVHDRILHLLAGISLAELLSSPASLNPVLSDVGSDLNSQKVTQAQKEMLP
jgi:DNA-binding IscR family transcriptional regulator